MIKCELLSPAGGSEALIAAVSAGADAVYLGGSCFNARQSAKNFTNEQLKDTIDYCHLRFVKVYVAVNTLVTDREFSELKEYIKFINSIGADGVIVQDLGVAKLIHEIAPDLPMHASTQMTVYDLNGALFLQNLGFKRVVLARELSREQIKEICEGTSLEVEVFVHGAICVSYSGQCLMSSMIGGRSGNRGRCAQPCRLLYSIENKSGYLLSPKDMCLINYINDLASIGVTSLKIEGRMKGPEYVGTVVSIYRKYIDSGEKVSKDDYSKLESIFYRGGFTDGYYTGKKGIDMFCHTKPDNPYLKQKSTEFEEFNRFRTINIKCDISQGKPIKLSANDEFGNEAEYLGETVSEMAQNHAITKERVTTQLSKLGGTLFKLGDCIINIDEGITIPISEINTARRYIIQILEEKIIDSFRREDLNKSISIITGNSKFDFTIAAQVSNQKQLEALESAGCKIIYAPYAPLDIADGHIPAIPRITSNDYWDKLNVKSALASNIGHIHKLSNMKIDIYADYSLNVFNQYAISVLEQCNVKRITVSSELMLSQIRGLSSSVPLEAVIYGHLPLMLTENCIIKSTVGCKKGGVITDRMGEKLTVRCVEGCKNEILNSKPIVMSDKISDIKNSGISVGRLFFTTESPKECIEIYNSYINNKKIDCDFTRGKFYKGVD